MAGESEKSREELRISVERFSQFVNLWTIYDDMLKEKYIPSVGERDWNIHDPRMTMMFMLYGYFYSLIEDSDEAINAFRIWREHFPEEEDAISAVEAQITRFKKDLRVFRNRLGFHGSRTREHEARGFDLFGSSTGTQTMAAMKNFKALASLLLAKDLASRKDDANEVAEIRERIQRIAARAREQTR